MTMDERVEAASVDLQKPGVSTPAVKAWMMLRAAFPELFNDPPTHKIVPLVSTHKMDEAGMADDSRTHLVDLSVDGRRRLILPLVLD